jgi:hypothetical protein
MEARQEKAQEAQALNGDPGVRSTKRLRSDLSHDIGRWVAGLAIAAFCLVATPQASGAAVIGNAHAVGSGGNSCGPIGGTLVQAASAGSTYAAPFDGVITSWGSRGWLSSISFKVARLGVGGTFTILAADGPRTYTGAAGELQSYPVRFTVRQGDVLAIQMPASLNHLCFPGDTGDSIGWRSGDVGPGASSSFEQTNPDESIPVQATIEHDADGDGYGDETQDLCPTDPSTHGICDVFPPETAITKGPKKKTKSKSATFEFNSSEAGSTFECSLDGAAFSACGSPMSVKVKKAGRHNFLVRARDSHGNLDTSEASWSWKVVKKHKKHKH